MKLLPEELRIPLADWPMSHIVMLVGCTLALWTGAKVLIAENWSPDGGWLAFVAGLCGGTFLIKRTTWKPESPQNVPPVAIPPGSIGTDPPPEKTT